MRLQRDPDPEAPEPDSATLTFSAFNEMRTLATPPSAQLATDGMSIPSWQWR